MTVNVGVMQLPVTEDPDPVREYLNGTHVSGGLWTALTRASNHDHSGGLNGVQLGATSIPDGSITAAKLDPAVLLPYALVDGSKPFTGQVALNADAIVRNTLYFGAKPAGAADATLARTGAGALRVDTHLGVGVAPQATWAAAMRAVQVGEIGALWANATSGSLRLSGNTFYDGTAQKALITGAASMVEVGGGSVNAYTAPSVAAGAAQTFTQRLALAQTGTLTLTPDAGQAAISIQNTSAPFCNIASNHYLTFSPPGAGWGVMPTLDNGIHLGATGNRWTVVYAVAGAINTSTAQVKEGITPLDPAACYEAAKAVRWYDFHYQPPAYSDPEPGPEMAYDEHDSNEVKAEKRALRDARLDESRAVYAKTLVETAPARHQRGFVFPPPGEAKDDLGGTLPPVPALFGLDDRESTTPQADLATLGCAMQEVIRRLEALEGQAA